MKPQYKQAYEQIRKLSSDKLYRFATDLLYLADTQRGHVDASQQDVCALHGGAWNNVRRALAELREQGVIYCMNADGMCLITFRSWLNYPAQTAGSDQNERENEPENAEIRANGLSPATSEENGQGEFRAKNGRN